MNLPCIVAALALVPQPRELVLTGCEATTGQVTVVRDESLPREGYRLSVTTNGVVIARSSPVGEFYARQTLAQLTEESRVPCVEIRDEPAYRWRGVHLDESRHFFGKQVVKQVLDLMAMHKLNVLHWHLTDDQGWRLDIPGYPELLRFAAVRPSSPIPGPKVEKDDGEKSYPQDGVRYGPYFYTEADVREVVAYAAERQITVVPEIELPGHVAAVLAAYPELACRPENFAHRHPSLSWGISKDVLCVGNNKTITFMENVLDYVCRVFPSPYVHIGGDECPRDRWSECPKCRRRVVNEGLKGVEGLQPWVTRHFVDFLAKRGKRAVGWDEYLDGDVPADAIGMTWRTPGQGTVELPILSGAAAAKCGHDLVVATCAYTYFCYGQGLVDDPYYGRDWGCLPLEKVYAFDPCRGIPDELRGHVLGGQCCNWSERTLSSWDLQWKMWPRACALSEVLWSGEGKPGFADFCIRMHTHRRRLIALFVNCAPVAAYQ